MMLCTQYFLSKKRQRSFVTLMGAVWFHCCGVITLARLNNCLVMFLTKSLTNWHYQHLDSTSQSLFLWWWWSQNEGPWFHNVGTDLVVVVVEIATLGNDHNIRKRPWNRVFNLHLPSLLPNMTRHTKQLAAAEAMREVFISIYNKVTGEKECILQFLPSSKIGCRTSKDVS